LLRLVALQRGLPEQAKQEIRNARTDALPQRRAVRLEGGPLQAARDAVLDEQLEAPQRNEFERVRDVVPRERARAP
jgi:sensor domain CHASE-containing protein